jgi:prepilin-type N-terminal cleavage/methylation domain-containing protein
MKQRNRVHIAATGTIRYARLRRGYFLIEMMIVLAVFAVFALVASKLLVTSMKASVDAQRRVETAERFDLAMNQLRADAWSSNQIEADGLSTTLRQADGRKVIWRIEPADAADAPAVAPNSPQMINLSRHAELGDGRADAASNDTRWNNLPSGMAFTASGPTLRVRAPTASPGADNADSITMISQLQLQGRTP